MHKFWSDGLLGITPYLPGEQLNITGLIKLNTNENPYPPSPAVLKAIQQETNDMLRRYPDPEGIAVKELIAQRYDLTIDHVFLGNGSDEVIAHTFLALLKHPLPILFPDISYSFYPVYCALYNIAHMVVPLDTDFKVNVQDYLQPNGGIVLANPNAPTGYALNQNEIELLLKQTPQSVVVIDEAYVAFGGESAVPLVKKFENLVVIHTLSKSHCLAGLRIGYAIGHPDLIKALTIVKDSFNSYPLDRLALAGAQAALEDQFYYEEICRKVINTRKWLTEALISIGFQVLPSKANFLFVRHPALQAKKIQHQLRERRILVRHFDQRRIDQFLRISVGTQQECQTLIQQLINIVKLDR